MIEISFMSNVVFSHELIIWSRSDVLSEFSALYVSREGEPHTESFLCEFLSKEKGKQQPLWSDSLSGLSAGSRGGHGAVVTLQWLHLPLECPLAPLIPGPIVCSV